MKNKLIMQIRQTNIRNLSNLTDDTKFEFQKIYEKELKDSGDFQKLISKHIALSHR